MTCPQCNGETKVTYTRDNIDYILRCRTCKECGYNFHTIETDKDMYKRLKRDSAPEVGGRDA